MSIDDGYTLSFTLAVDDTVNNATYTSSFDVRVIRSVLQMYSYSVAGDAMPGESFALEVSVTNVGSLAENTEVVLESLDERLHFDGGDFMRSYGSIGRDSVVSRQFPMRADATVQGYRYCPYSFCSLQCGSEGFSIPVGFCRWSDSRVLVAGSRRRNNS